MENSLYSIPIPPCATFNFLIQPTLTFSLKKVLILQTYATNQFLNGLYVVSVKKLVITEVQTVLIKPFFFFMTRRICKSTEHSY